MLNFIYKFRLALLRVSLLIFFILSLIMGLMSITLLWFLFGVFAFICVYFAFPNTWKLCFWLALIYLFSIIGVVFLTIENVFGIKKLPASAIGLILEFVSFIIVFSLISEGRKLKSKAPLGFWSISVIIFYIFSNLSMYSWSMWYKNAVSIGYYTFFEAFLIMLFFFILIAPEDIYQKIEFRALEVSKKICPICNYPLQIEKRKCPFCDFIETTGFCPKSEISTFPCPNCGEHTIYGKEKCSYCNATLQKNLFCRKCNRTSELWDWKKQQP
ncbi:MAG: hypothetical protein AB1779_07125 [Candidatus Thermoplasmatota archaeon]